MTDRHAMAIGIVMALRDPVTARELLPAIMPAKPRLVGETLQSTIDSQTAEAIAETVRRYYLLDRELMNTERRKVYSHPRQVAMYLIHRHTSMRLKDIGEIFGGRDHSTVLWAVDSVRSKMFIDSETAHDVKEIEALLSPELSTIRAAYPQEPATFPLALEGNATPVRESSSDDGIQIGATVRR